MEQNASAAEAAASSLAEQQLPMQQAASDAHAMWEQLLLGTCDETEIAQQLQTMTHPFRDQEMDLPLASQGSWESPYQQFMYGRNQEHAQVQPQYPPVATKEESFVDLTNDDDEEDYNNNHNDNHIDRGEPQTSYQYYYHHQQQYQQPRYRHSSSQSGVIDMPRQSTASRQLPWCKRPAQQSMAQRQAVAAPPTYVRHPPALAYCPRIEVFFRLLSLTHFTISARPKQRMHELLNTIKLIPGVEFDSKLRKWKFPINQHVALRVAISENCRLADIYPLPERILRMLSLAHQRRNHDEQVGSAEDLLRGRVHPRLLHALAPFQKDGVAFIVKRDGRALLADEMGLGKTIQALAAVCAFDNDWPVLVICPSSARYHWKNEIVQWCTPEVADPSEVLVINSASQPISGQQRFYITSYSLVTSLQPQIDALGCQAIIADECHYLKNPRAKRTKTILPMLHNARRAIMLSGTPALSRPYELFPQLNAIDPYSWASPKEFGKRYCRSKRKRSGGGEYRGATNISELHALLKGTLMIRRRKRDILKELPPKLRHFEHFELQDNEVRDELRALLAQVNLVDVKLARKKHLISKEEKVELKRERKSALLSLFTKSGVAKLPLTLKWLQVRLDNVASGKFLVFGHHRQVLDGVQQYLIGRGMEFMRIDGSTPPSERHIRAKHFQTSNSCRVAILGIAAAGIALTLTAASTVLFAELFWTPGALVQAEDRAHRIGQTSDVHVTYLLTKDTVDDVLWPLVQKKMKLLGEVVEGEDNVGMENDLQQVTTSSTLADNLEQIVEELAAEEAADGAGALVDDEDDIDGETKDGSASMGRDGDDDDNEEDGEEWQNDEADEDDDLAEESVRLASRQQVEVIDLVDDEEDQCLFRSAASASAASAAADGNDRKRQTIRTTSAESTMQAPSTASHSSNAYQFAFPPLLPEFASNEPIVIDDFP